MWLFKKKKPQGPLVWMIQKVDSDSSQPLFMGVCKDQLVSVSSWRVCLRFSDFEAAGLFLYWLIQSGKTKEGSFRVAPVQIPLESENEKRKA
jgi:hypothetical protein